MLNEHDLLRASVSVRAPGAGGVQLNCGRGTSDVALLDCVTQVGDNFSLIADTVDSGTTTNVERM